jgi:ribosome biogenesis GTPase / thiamine phosphate phosphatase
VALSHNPLDLAALGWRSQFAEHFAPLAAQGLLPARVAVRHNQLYRLYAEQGELLAEVSGKVRHEAAGHQDFPVVGDWVAMSARPSESRATIHAILPRSSRFSRKAAGLETEEQVLAANVDTVFLVAGLDGDFNLRRLERYLVMAWDSGAAPVILLSKSDLCEDVPARLAEVEAIAAGVPLHAVSSLRREGLDAVRGHLAPGRTVALLGSSGVGKSTLVNALLGEERLRTREVRLSDSRGRHTTTSRELIALPEGGLVIDTPGMRELAPWDAVEALPSFEDVDDLATGCAFKDCRHEVEPRCAVQLAVEQGRLSAERLEGYRKLQREARHLSVKQDQRARLEQKRQWRVIHKAARNHKPRE